MRVAIVGGGTVGGGVVEMLKRYSADIHVVYIVVRDLGKVRDFTIPPGCKVTDDISSVMNDPSVDVVVELMGGVDSAWTDVVKPALQRGTNVVTGNKALISKHLPEIEAIVKSRTKKGAFLFEAAVCGGIPVVNSFMRGMAGDHIRSVFGVMNGSTNWMLDKMEKEGTSYESLLTEAKTLGYLEADPAADIQGWDARSKLCILARIAFGVSVDEHKVNCVGIDVVDQSDIAYAKSIDRSIRLLAKSWKHNNSVHAFVMPALVPADMTLHGLPGSGNCVCYSTKHSGVHAILGSGAGRYPTANSVVADILEIHRCQGGFDKPFGDVDGTNVKFDSDFNASFYIRTGDDISKVLNEKGLLFQQVGQGVYVTTECSYNAVRDALGGLMKRPTVMVIL